MDVPSAPSHWNVDFKKHSRSLAIGLLAALAVLSTHHAAAAQVQIKPPDLDFKGRFLLVASDTDMLPSAYIDNRLGPLAGPDQLSVVQLNQLAGRMTTGSIDVSNSVIGPPSSIALTPDGRYAIVIETRGQRPPNRPDAVLGDLPPGKQISVIDLADLAHPKVVQRPEGYDDPSSVSIDPDGTLAAIVYKQVGKVKHPLLALYRIEQGRLSAPMVPDIPGPEANDALVSAEFHPKMKVLGLVYAQHPRLALVKVNTSRSQASLSLWGNPVDLDIGPFLVRFTPDGRFAIVNAMLLGTEIRGTVSSIRLDQGRGADGEPKHRLVSRVEAGFQPEGLAISPDEHWVATTNLEHSTYALDDRRQGFFASVSLLRFDAQTGLLSRVGEFPFDGRLPESAVFDNSSRFLAVTCFAHYDPAQPGGAIDFWRIAGDVDDPTRAELVKMHYSVPVARGPQSMVIAR